ncbi:PLP-dependent aminotransferase family protein [Leucobacter chromiiresistens]|uniref:GntR family transcriptional regulator / MocR family aminotransferase n=3 Tax=Leucobacter chromiiresistens TaxID=1079994 RepID=A0A1H1AD18_9MICO|nr:PLP-dependent aminotransferase family protein [Leucobacter chromiiresistens]SDQ37562.1 GntR family transcriptional regulator / MocR family aminotransferase [Leucobacter chromiiresistens]
MSARTRAVSGLPVHIDRSSSSPLPVQIAAALREAIDASLIRPGEAVPATRDLSRRLGVARGVVVAAYEQLIAEGYLAAAQGRGTLVHPDLARTSPGAGAGAGVDPARPAIPVDARPDGEGRAPTDESLLGAERPAPLAPGAPITEGVVSSAWRSAWREAAASLEVAATVAPPLGDPSLRREIAEHLRRMRGTPRAAADVLVTAGTRDGLWLLLTALGATRGRTLAVGVEDPGLPSLRGAVSRAGASIIALPADALGLDTARLPDGMLDAVIVTPSHQYPLGGSLPLARRRELLAWAHRNGVVIIEDDFDSELRYTGTPLPTLAALDDAERGVVVLLGTFSRTITPALSAGYLLAPAGLRALIEPVRRDLGGPVSSVVQSALAAYLASGELRRHTVRMLRRYAVRRDLVSERLAGAERARVRPMDGGLHAVIEFSGDPERARRREADVIAEAEPMRLGVQALGRYWQRTDRDAGMAGLVIGVGGDDDAAFDAALRELRGILDRV